MRVIVGGTFTYLHKGHRKLLKKAFSIGDFVYIGLTSDSFVKKNKGLQIKSYPERKNQLVKFISKLGKRFVIVKLYDSYGPSIRGRFDAIVVSKETYKTAEKINKIRKRNKLKQLKVYKVRYANAYDGRPISSRRIYSNEIDINGEKL